MPWRKLIPASLGCAFLLACAVAAFAPNSASAAEVVDCADNEGNLCHWNCLKECSVGPGCCDETFLYYPKNSG